MKNLIIIGAYCPDYERQKLLNDCIDSLSPLKKDFDFLISTHSLLPEYIVKKVDYVFYDKKNELITDWNLINKPWFSPFDGVTIMSTLVTGYSTFLAAYRIFIGALGLAKNFKYNKVHWVEYDSYFTKYDDFYENNKLLDSYTAVQYKKENRNFEKNLDWGYGCFQAINTEKLDDIFLIYDEEKLIEILKNCPNKTNEKTTEEIYKKNGGTIYFKDFTILSESNKFNLSENTSKENLNYWVVPYFDQKSNLVNVVAWNNKDEEKIDVIFIINDERIIPIKNLEKFGWSIKEVGPLEEINTIVTLVNGRVKTRILFDDEKRDLFKKTSYSTHNDL